MIWLYADKELALSPYPVGSLLSLETTDPVTAGRILGECIAMRSSIDTAHHLLPAASRN